MTPPDPLWERQTLLEMRQLIAEGPLEVRLARPALLVLLDMALEREQVFEAGFAAGVSRERLRLDAAWEKSWDCSADPGHRIMNAAFDATPPTPNP